MHPRPLYLDRIAPHLGNPLIKVLTGMRRVDKSAAIRSPYRLSSTDPACGCQKGRSLAIGTPHLAVLRYIVRAALYSDP